MTSEKDADDTPDARVANLERVNAMMVRALNAMAELRDVSGSQMWTEQALASLLEVDEQDSHFKVLLKLLATHDFTVSLGDEDHQTIIREPKGWTSEDFKRLAASLLAVTPASAEPLAENPFEDEQPEEQEVEQAPAVEFDPAVTRRRVAIAAEVAQLEEQLAALKAEAERLDECIMAMFVEQGTTSLTQDGRNICMQSDFFLRYPMGREPVCEALRKLPMLAPLVKQDFNTTSLKSTYREVRKGVIEPILELEGLVEVEETHKIVVRLV
jgi:hypothetical protein